jgi:hypothetical protein
MHVCMYVVAPIGTNGSRWRRTSLPMNSSPSRSRPYILVQPFNPLTDAAVRPGRSLRPLRRVPTPRGCPTRPRRHRRRGAVAPRSGPIPAAHSRRCLSLPSKWPQWRTSRPIRGAWLGPNCRRGADQTAMWVTPSFTADSQITSSPRWYTPTRATLPHHPPTLPPFTRPTLCSLSHHHAPCTYLRAMAGPPAPPPIPCPGPTRRCAPRSPRGGEAAQQPGVPVIEAIAIAMRVGGRGTTAGMMGMDSNPRGLARSDTCPTRASSRCWEPS